MQEKQFYRKIIQNSPLAYAFCKIICNRLGQPENYEFIEVNSCFEKITGLKRTELIGKTGKEIFSMLGESDDERTVFYSVAALSGVVKNFKFYSETLERWFKVFVYSPEQGYFVIQYIDLGDEIDLKERLEYEQLLHKISVLAVDFESLTDFLITSLQLMGETLKVSRVYIFEHCHQNDTMNNTFEWAAPGCTREKNNLQSISASAAPWWMKVLKANLIICYKDIEGIPDEGAKTILRKQEIKSILVVPLFINEKYYGFIGFDQNWKQREWPEEDVNLLVSISRIISQAICRKQTEQILEDERLQLLSLFDSISKSIYVTDPDTYEIIFANQALKKEFGCDLVGKICYRVLQRQEQPCFFCRTISTFNEQPYQREIYNPITKKNYQLIDRMIRWSDGRNVRFEMAIDITELKCAQKALLKEKEFLRVTLHSIGDGVITTDRKGNIVMFNKTAEKLTGWSQQEAAGRPLMEVFDIIDEKTQQRCENPLAKILETGKSISLANNTILRSRTGALYFIADSAAPIKDQQGVILGVVIVFRDVSAEKKRAEQIIYLSCYDKLTGLYNRSFFEEKLKRLDTESQLPIALIMGDVNGLKMINDVFGHQAGDWVLKLIAQILKKTSRAEDIIARWGGDEFVLFLPQTSRQEAGKICDRIRNACADYNHDNQDSPIRLSISLGHAAKEKTSESIIQVLKQAEDFMYKRKLLESKSLRSSIITSMKKTLYERSNETVEHAGRLNYYSNKIGSALSLTENELDDLQLLSMLHDLGKIAIKDSILIKPGLLTQDEWLEMKKHPEIGYRIAQSIPELVGIAEYILSHHEKWDGSGYPQGLKGEEIPLLARILAVVDAYDAMTNDRFYRKALTPEEAKAELLNNAGTQFDPMIVKIFLEEVLKC